MKLKAMIFTNKPDNSTPVEVQPIPDVLVNVRDVSTSKIADLMLLYGIAGITLNQYPVGLNSMCSPELKYAGNPDEYPFEIQACMGTVARAIMELMKVNGLTQLELEDVEEDFKVIKEGWLNGYRGEDSTGATT